jgi:hypothetical protein
MYEEGSEWVFLEPMQSREAQDGIYFSRGVDVRLSEISWVADCPFGS